MTPPGPPPRCWEQGILPAALWGFAFLWCLALRRSAFRAFNLWIASVALVAFTLGVMGLFEAADGPLAAFTLDGQVSLGGEVGSAIAGPSAWRSALQLGALLALTLAIASPALAAAAAKGVAAISMLAYFAAVATGGAIRGMYRRDEPKPLPTTRRTGPRGRPSRTPSPGSSRPPRSATLRPRSRIRPRPTTSRPLRR